MTVGRSVLRRPAIGWIALAARLLTGGVWVVAGLVKIGDPAASVQAVRAYQILPWQAAEVVGRGLPSLEVVIGVALILGLLSRGAAAVSGLLFLAFIIAIASAWSRGIEIDCGCFGGGGYDPDATDAYPWEILRDAGLLLCSGVVVAVGGGRFTLDRVLFGAPEPVGDDEE